MSEKVKPYSEHMVTCPKCGYATISGPTYRPPLGLSGELMVWRCNRCGYVEETKCREGADREGTR